MTTRPSRFLLRAALLTLVPIAAAGCESPEPATLPTPLESIAGEWTLTWLGGDGAPALPSDRAQRPTLRVGPDGQVSGFAGVNRYSTRVSPEALSSGRFSLGTVATTRMAGPPESMDLEARFLDALARASAFRRQGDLLAIADATADLLRFTSAGGR